MSEFGQLLAALYRGERDVVGVVADYCQDDVESRRRLTSLFFDVRRELYAAQEELTVSREEAQEYSGEWCHALVHRAQEWLAESREAFNLINDAMRELERRR